MKETRKCGIIGCGDVGASTAFALMQSRLFNDMVLIDVNQAKAEGEAMDISHSLPFNKPMDIYQGDYSDLKDAGIIIITAGAAQKPNETRLDLVHKNVGIFKSIIPEIMKYNQDAILLVVSNPVDILTWVTLKLSDLPAERVIGSGTVLDTGRLKYLVGKHLDVDPRSVHSYIIGEHGDSEVAVWSSASIGSVLIDDFCEMRGHKAHPETRARIAEEVRNSAYEIIKRKGSTYYGIASAVTRICECILRDEHSILPISSFICGHFGLKDVCMSVPTILGEKGVEKILDIKLNAEEEEQLAHSYTTLKEILAQIKL